MNSETSYQKDFIVTWVCGKETTKEGFSKTGLDKYTGVTYVAKILQCYNEFNSSKPLKERRFVTLIEGVTRQTLWEKETLKDDDDA